jgi:hypothetical protein
MRSYAKEVAGIDDDIFPLFASAITGRDYRAVKAGVTSRERTKEEKDNITDALGEGMLAQLVQLLSKVPRVLLLILKTNDLSTLFAGSFIFKARLTHFSTLARREPPYQARVCPHIPYSSQICFPSSLRGAA